MVPIEMLTRTFLFNLDDEHHRSNLHRFGALLTSCRRTDTVIVCAIGVLLKTECPVQRDVFLSQNSPFLRADKFWIGRRWNNFLISSQKVKGHNGKSYNHLLSAVAAIWPQSTGLLPDWKTTTLIMAEHLVTSGVSPFQLETVCQQHYALRSWHC